MGNPGEFTIRQLAEKVIGMTGSRSELVFHPLPSDDPRQRCPDTSLARQVLGWEPSIQLEEGLVNTIKYFDEFLKETAQRFP
jgi:UDP-glucuronate decarboxylase